MDTVYVIYLDNNMYTANGRKCAYLEPSGAKQVITADSKELAHEIYKEQRKTGEPSWYDLSREEEKPWIEKAGARFEIREFVERR